MFTKRFYILLFLTLTLLPLPMATADFTITNGSSTETAWVIYSTYRSADANWETGFRTRGWYKVDPGASRTLWAPQNNDNVYIHVERGGRTILPPDAATRFSKRFRGHSEKAFTVIETSNGNFVESDLGFWELEVFNLYRYNNGGRYTIGTASQNGSLAEQVYAKYEETFQLQDVQAVLPVALAGLKDPDVQPLLTPQTIAFVVSNPDTLRQFVPGIDPAFVTLLKQDQQVRQILLDPLVQRLLQNSTAIDELAALIQADSSLSPNQIYNQTIASLLWIYRITEDGNYITEHTGSGALIDVDRQLAVTNQHVVGDAGWVYVSFPVQNQSGTWISNRNYYKNNYLDLAVDGHGSWARVIATDVERDIAILQLNFVRDNSIEVNHDFTKDLSLELTQGDRLHVLGNPADYQLWQWTLGTFEYPILGQPVGGYIWRWTPGRSRLEDTDWLQINASIYGGNSGGPVLNSNGQLVGIITSSDEETTSWASPVRYVKELLDTVQPRHTIEIANPSTVSVSYELKWSASDNWTTYSLSPHGYWRQHWWNGNVAAGYPKIRFNTNGVLSWGADKSYNLNPFLRYFGNNYRDHVSAYDVESYYFDYNNSTRKLDMYRSYDDSEGCGQASDANGDGKTDLQDLAYIESQFGWWGDEAADVNSDGVVNTDDLIYAAGLACGVFASPTFNPDVPPTITAEKLQRWIDEGKALDRDEPTYQRGIAALENLLAIIKRAEAIPKENALLPNYPNPFNPETWIPYELSEPATVRVTIYAADGQVVRELALGQQSAGVYQNKNRAAYWDGKNTFGEPVATGIYFYTLQAGEFTATRKMVIRK